MNQETFLKQLESLLSDIPEDERREALEYYRCYFEDAGIENEASVLAELVSPERVAQTIKADLQGNIADGGFTEKGYEEFTEKSVPGTKEQIDKDEKAQARTAQAEENTRSSYTDVWEKMPDPNQYEDYRKVQEESRRHQEQQGTYQENSGQRRRTRRSGGSVVGKIFAIFGIGVAIVAVVIALVAAAVGLIAATVAVGGTVVMLLGVAIGLFVAGAFATALALMGGGFICLAFFFLLLLAVVAVCGKALPAALRGICNAAGDILFDRGERTR